MHAENSIYLEYFRGEGGVDSVTWSNPLEILKGGKCGVNGTVDA